jgi:hypothetical protein
MPALFGTVYAPRRRAIPAHVHVPPPAPKTSASGYGRSARHPTCHGPTLTGCVSRPARSWSWCSPWCSCGCGFARTGPNRCGWWPEPTGRPTPIKWMGDQKRAARQEPEPGRALIVGPRAGVSGDVCPDKPAARLAGRTALIVDDGGPPAQPPALRVRSPPGIVVFVHDSGSSRQSPRNRFVASVLTDAGLGTLLFDMLTPEEEQDRANVFDMGLLAKRLTLVTAWLRGQSWVADVPPAGSAPAPEQVPHSGRPRNPTPTSPRSSPVAAAPTSPGPASGRCGHRPCSSSAALDTGALDLNRSAQANPALPERARRRSGCDAAVRGARHTRLRGDRRPRLVQSTPAAGCSRGSGQPAVGTVVFDAQVGSNCSPRTFCTDRPVWTYLSTTALRLCVAAQRHPSAGVDRAGSAGCCCGPKTTVPPRLLARSPRRRVPSITLPRRGSSGADSRDLTARWVRCLRRSHRGRCSCEPNDAADELALPG